MDVDTVNADAFNTYEAAGWEERAAAYVGQLAAVTRPAIEPTLDAAWVGAGTRVLDVASGAGHGTAACAARGADVLGLDISASMVAIARQNYPKLTFTRGDVQQLPIGDATMDAVVGNFVILHVGRPEQAAAEFARVLVPAGRLALTVWNVPVRARLIGVLMDAIEEAGAVPPPELPPGPPFFRFADEAEFSGLLTGAGFVEVGVQTVDYVHRMGNATQLWDALLAGSVRLSPLVLGQTETVQAKIRAAFDRLTAEYATPEGGFAFPISVKLASGSRAG